MAPRPNAEPEVSTAEPMTTLLLNATLQAITNVTSEPPRPEGEQTPVPETGAPSPGVEPTPKWSVAKQEWGAAWPVYWIGFAALFLIFSLLVLYAFVQMVFNRRSRKRATLTKFSTTVWSVLLTFGLSRALYLLLNPHENGDCLFGESTYCPDAMNRVLFSLGLPGLTTAFLLFHFAFLEVTKIKGAGRLSKLQSTPFLVLLAVFNYAFVITADLVVWYHSSVHLLVTLCQSYFIILGISIMILFLYSASGIFVSSKRNWNSIQRIQDGKLDPELANLRRSRFYVTPQLQKVIRLTFLTVGIWAIYVLFQTIAFVVTLTGALSSWPFLIFESFYRLCELLLGFSIFYAISARPSSDRASTRRGRSTKQTFSRKYTVRSSNESPSTFHSDVKLVAVAEHDTASQDETCLTNGTDD